MIRFITESSAREQPMIEFGFGPEDLLACRFAISPLEEVVGALRTLAQPALHAYHLPWVHQVAERAATLDLAPLLGLYTANGYTPDFLSPPPVGPLIDIDAQLDRVRATPVAQVARELDLCVAGRSVPAAVRPLLDDPAAGRDRLAELLEQCWDRLLRPYWPQLRDLLEADIAYRAHRLVEHGTRAVFADLHPQVRWARHAVRINSVNHDRRQLSGQGLLLVPSAFTWPSVAAMTVPPWQPALIYPARGIAALWQRPSTRAPQALRRLLGAARARLLLDLSTPATTTALARRYQAAPSTISEHLKVLSRAGLVIARRNGRHVPYERTPLGHALIAAQNSG